MSCHGFRPRTPNASGEDFDQRIKEMEDAFKVEGANPKDDNPKPPTREEWLQLAALNEGLIETEWRLLNDRIAWLLTSQGLLLTGYFALALADKFVGKHVGMDGADLDHALSRFKAIVPVLLSIFPLIALLVIVAGILGALAALKVADRLEVERAFYQTILERQFRTYVVKLGLDRERGLKFTKLMGIAPFWGICIVLVFVWLLFFLAQSMPSTPAAGFRVPERIAGTNSAQTSVPAPNR